MSQSDNNKQRFCELLRATGRENIEYVIEDLETYGFFEAPASVRNHLNTPEDLSNTLSMSMTRLSCSARA